MMAEIADRDLAGFLEAERAKATASGAYAIYRQVRDWVLRVYAAGSGKARPSEYWAEEIEGFGHMFDASPLVVARLREHCYHLTGLRSNDYRKHHHAFARPFRRKLEMLREKDERGLFVPESAALGGFGHAIDGALVNLDTLKYYEALIAMDGAGLLNPFRTPGPRQVVVEIGGGWGGLAYQFKSLFPNVTYVIVDLPATFLFSAVYLQAVFPQARTHFVEPDERGVETLADVDFVFAPAASFDSLNLTQPALAMNTVSFQEMTGDQVEGYASRLAALGCASLYSLNRERSPYNDALRSVTDHLSRYYRLRRIDPLGVPYYWLPNEDRPVTRLLRKVSRGILRDRSRDDLLYKHMAGELLTPQRT